MNLDAHTGAEPRQHLYFNDVPFFYQSILVWLNGMVVLLIVTLFASGLTTSPKTVSETAGFATLEAIVMAVVYPWAGRRNWDIRRAHGAGLLLHVLIGLYWLTVLSCGSSVFVVETLFLLVLLYRSHRLYQTTLLTVENRSGLLIDTVLILIAASYYYWWLIPMSTGNAVSMRPFVGDWILMAVVLRIYALWKLERLESSTLRASARAVWALIGVVVLVIVFLQHGLIKTAMAIFGVIGLIMTPIIYLFPKFHVQTKPLQRVRPQSSNSAGNQTLLTGVNHTTAVHWLIYGILLVAVLVVLYLLLRRRVVADEQEQRSEETDALVVRRKIEEKDLFLPTDNPVRLRAQHWMSAKLKEGLIHPARTWRQMTHRDAESSGDFAAFVREYDNERYGQTTSRQQDSHNSGGDGTNYKRPRLPER